MTNLFDALEFCLQEMERGAEIESILARFPEHAEELRPILKTAAKAQQMAVVTPDADVARRSRAKVMQHAAELRESRVAPRRPRNVIPLFQRLAISVGLAAFFLLSGSGLLSASASALPGEQLYPVKRGWENIRLFFIFDSEARTLLEDEFENERLHEVNELLADGRDEVIEFAGVFMQVNGIAYVSGLQVVLPSGMPVPANGQPVIVSGQTNAQGFVEVISLELLPAGSVVPAGNPIEMEIESSEEETSPSSETSSGSSNEATEVAPVEYEVSGILESISTSELVINGMTVYLGDYILEQAVCVGMEIEVKGYYAPDGRFIVQEAKGKGECSNGGASSGSNSNSNSNSGSSSNDNSSNSGNTNSDDDSNDDNSNDDNGDDSGDDDSDDDNSGSGGGGDDNDD